MSTHDDGVDALVSLIENSRHLVVLTGAGCSTESGIPDYRDANGKWKHRRPVQYPDFVRSHAVRQRYWARSMIGWQRIAAARPNRAHRALARLQRAGRLRRLITQNIDGLHQLAGSREVIDLHGRLAEVVCLNCGHRRARQAVQQELLSRNPRWHACTAAEAPDGDAQIEADFSDFVVPQCGVCNGVLKPDVVFFGETVPAERVAQSFRAVEQADCLLVAGSSLMVWSGLRFVRAASQRGLPTALINLGRTRADELFTHRVTRSCGDALSRIVAQLVPAH